jgi:peroxiredoxin
MMELGELDSQFADFTQRGVRLIAVSVDDLESSEQTQRRFPNLIVLADPERQLTEAIQAMHRGAGPGRSDVAAPTTLLLDETATVRWAFRPDRVIVRLKPRELADEIDAHLAKTAR